MNQSSGNGASHAFKEVYGYIMASLDGKWVAYSLKTGSSRVLASYRAKKGTGKPSAHHRTFTGSPKDQEPLPLHRFLESIKSVRS